MSTSLESFVNVLRRSGLIEESAIAESVAKLVQPSPQPTSPQQSVDGNATGEMLAEALVSKELITSWQASKLLQGKHKGFFLGKYRLLRLLGKGGMSSVYLAEHVLMRRRCAIKVLPWKLVKDSSYLQRFHREAQAVASLDHPNIVRAYDVDHEQDGNLEIHFLVMEYVEGKNLFDLVQQSGPLPPAVAAEYIRQGAKGLVHAHAAGMVHRDVKPGNFIVDQNGIVKLMDLGLARVAAQEDHSLTIAHDERVLGTADYLAPEQAVDSHLVDARADLYSLGCTLYFLLTGRPPFNEGTLAQRLLAHQTKEPTSPHSLRKNLPDTLLVILRGLMEKDREKRIQTAADVVTLLDHWFANDAETPTLGETSEATAAGSSVTTPRAVTPGRSSAERGSAERTGAGRPEAKRPAVNSPGRPADVATRSPQPASHNPLGDFLTSLSDVDASEAKQPSSARQISDSAIDSATMKLNRSETDNAPVSETGHEDHFDLLPDDDDDDDNPFAVIRDPSSIKTGPRSPSSKLSPSKSGSSKSMKRKSPSADSLEKIKSAIPPELLTVMTKYRLPLAIGGGVLALLITVGLVYAFVGGGKPKSSAGSPATANTATPQTGTAQPPATPKAPAVERPEIKGPVVTVGPKGNFGTLKEAIEYVKISGLSSLSTAVNEIQIEGKQILNESLSIDNSGLGGFPRGIRIVGQSAEPPQLQPENSDAAILLDSVEGLVIENLVVNCRGRSEGILVRGYSSSTSFINVTLENVQGTGLKGVGLSGLSGRSVVIQRCTFRAISGTARGIHFDATSGSDARYVTVGQCRFLGPMAAGITVEGSGESIDFNQNLFHWNTSGILFTGSDPILKKTRLVNNTFVGGEYGIRFDSSLSSNSNGFVIENNLFAKQSNSAVSLPETKAKLTQGGSAQSNWTDGKAPEDSGLNIFQQNGVTDKEVEFASDDASSPDFLKPKTPEVRNPNAPGTLKYFGAVSP